MAGDHSIDLSVVIVNYNVRHFAEQCLHSVLDAAVGLEMEVFVVDNASTDDSVEFLKPKFPSVTFIANSENLGFARANNIALSKAHGRYLMILNPDTLVGRGELKAMVDYMEGHSEVGVAGPKTLTRYGEFDKASKRGLPTPWVAFCRLSGLSALFPRSPLFGKYDLLYLDPDKPAEVDALTGACMIIRRKAYEQVGGLDESFFMYGEDIDWCYRFKLAGWKVHYAPVASIIHFRGESTRRSTIDRDNAFYGAMHLFVEKHFRGRYPYLAHKFIDFGIFLAELISRLKRIYHRFVWPATDFFLVYLILISGRLIRFEGTYGFGPVVFAALGFQALIVVLSLTAVGAYGRRRGDNSALIIGLLLSFFINSSFTYFFKQFAYSRFVNLFSLTVGGGVLWGWRTLLHRLKSTQAYLRFYRRRALVVGVGDTARRVLQALNIQPTPVYTIVGLVDPDSKSVGSLLEGVPVLGSEEELGRLIELEEIEEVLFAHDSMDYNRILQLVTRIGGKGVGFKVIASDEALSNEGDIPFLSVEYLSPRGFGKSLRRLTTIVLGR